MSNPEPGGSRPNIVLIGAVAVAIAGAALFFVTNKPPSPPAPPAVATAPANPVPSTAPANSPAPANAPAPAATPAPAPVAAPEPPPPPPPKPREITTIPSLEWNGTVFRVKLNALNLVNATLPREELEKLLKSDNLTALADGLAKLSADEFTIESIDIESELHGQKDQTIYRNVTGGAIAAGVFSRVEIAETRQVGSTLDANKNPLPYTASFGTMSVEALAPIIALRWLTDADPSGTAPFRPVYGQYAVAGAEVNVKDFKIALGRSTGSGVKLRTLRRPAIEMWPSFDAFMKKQNAEPEEPSAEIIANLLEIYAGFELGQLDVGPIQASGKTEAGDEFRFRLGDMRIGGQAKSTIAGGELTLKQGVIRLGGMNWEGDFYQLLFVALGQAALQSDAVAKEPEAQVARLKAELARQKVPDARFRLEGLEVDVEQKNNPGQRVAFSVAGFETRNDAFIGAVPTAIALKVSNFRLPIQPTMRDETLQQLRAMGIDTLDLSFNLEGGWNEAQSTVTFGDISTSVEKVGAVSLNFALGNVPRALFENPAEAWTGVLITGLVKEVGFAINNRGGLEKAVEVAAAQQGKKPEQLRLEIATMAPLMLVMGLGEHPDVTVVTEAVMNFVRGFNSLVVKARTAEGEGVRLIELGAAASDPTATLKKLRFEATGK